MELLDLKVDVVLRVHLVPLDFLALQVELDLQDQLVKQVLLVP